MSLNKAFVVKNGLEVNTNLILADANTNKVGIGSTAPKFELDVAGGIGATDSYVIGVSTVFTELNVGTDGSVLTVLGIGGSVGVGTATPEYLLDVRSPVSTGQTALYVQGDVRVTGDLDVDDITFDQADINSLNVIGIATISQLEVTNSTSTTNLTVSGISTYNDYVDINNNVDISGTLNVGGATTLTGYVDVNNSLDVSVDINVGGLTTLGGYVDINDSVDISADLNVSGIATLATVDINAGDIDVTNIDTTNINVSGIATIGSVSIVGASLSTLSVSQSTDLNNLNVTGITTLGTVQISSGVVTSTSGIVTYYGDGSYLTGNARNLTATIGIKTSGGVVGYGVSFLDIRGSGVSTAFYDANVGIATIFFEGGGSGIVTSLTLATQTASNPSLSFIGDTTTGLFSPGTGEQTFVSVGASVLNINASGIIVTGIATAQDFDALSDINFKENVTTVNNALLKVEQLRGVKFDWKESGNPSYGVIAQELEQVLPELVHGDDPKTVNYNGIIGVLIEAIKELKFEIEELKSNK